MAQPFLDAVVQRRSYYSIAPELPEGVTEARIEEIVNLIFTHVPSPFNSQSARAIVLFRKEHEKLWDFTHDTLKSIVSAEAFPATEQRIHGFKNGYGTILFFEESAIVKDMQAKFTRYSDKFPQWSDHTNAMHQFAIWTALEAEGLGANLQHYNPLIDTKVREEWNVPASWTVVAQMPFGKIAGPHNVKNFLSLDERVKYFGRNQQ